MMRTSRFAKSVLCTALLTGAPSKGDLVTLKDGRVFEGIIVLESPRKVTIETMVVKFKTQMTFERSQVASTERRALPEGFFDPAGQPDKKKPETTEAPKPRERAKEPAARTTRYVEIPIEGTIGVDVQAEGVERALETAISRGVQHAVFVINSPGGYVAEADAIAEVIEAKRDDIACYAVVDSAISAAIWVTISCDRVFMRRCGQLGGAVVYSQDRTTGAAEVDAKMNSIIAARLASKAQRSGIHGDAVRAMIIPDAEFYAWENDAGVVVHGVRAPEGVSPEHLLIADGSASVLTLTGEQAVAASLVESFAGQLDELGALVDAEGWESAGNIGASAMAAAKRAHEREAKQQEDLIDDIRKAFTDLKSMQDEALRADPSNFTYTYDPDTNLLVGASQIAWRENTDRCMSLWRGMMSQSERIERMLRRAEQLGLERGVQFEDLKEYYDACEKALITLEKNRNRYYVNR